MLDGPDAGDEDGAGPPVVAVGLAAEDPLETDWEGGGDCACVEDPAVGVEVELPHAASATEHTIAATATSSLLSI